MRLNLFSTWISFLSLSSTVKVISTHDEEGLLHSFWLHTNLPVTLPHRMLLSQRFAQMSAGIFRAWSSITDA